MDMLSRRTWLKTSLLTIAGTTLLLPEVKAKLIHETEKKYKLGLGVYFDWSLTQKIVYMALKTESLEAGFGK